MSCTLVNFIIVILHFKDRKAKSVRCLIPYVPKIGFNESDQRKTFLSYAMVPLGKLPDTHHYDMERDADLLGQ